MTVFTDLRDILKFAPLQSPLSARGGTRVSPFTAGWSDTVGLLERELRMVGARHAVMEVDIAPGNIRQDGMPRADRAARTPGIVLSFKATAVPKSPDLRYEVVEFSTMQDNVRAVALGLQALRAVDRYGVTKLGEQYQGWAQLAAGTAGEGDPARGRELIAEAGGDWRRAAALTHPDLNPDANPDDFKHVIAARDSGR
jgi:hypothetical protein